MPVEPTALLVLRVWRESASPVPLRTEIRMTRDVSAGFERSFTLTSVDEVVETVREWLVETNASRA